ncbi:MAG TPA: ISL3 family transposase [Acidimicrobiia bacterium]|nr:ISL3 family transposase [Acidimicrobiia bacterium]
MLTDPTRVSESLVGLPDVVVLGVDDEPGSPLVVHVEQAGERPACFGCGAAPVVKDRQRVVLVDLPAYGRRSFLCWWKFRFSCRLEGCPVKSWTWADKRIAAPRLSITDRAGRWATEQVGRHGRTVSEVARDLGCDWHTLNDTVLAYGTPLVEDPQRVGEVAALGLDETLFCRRGRWRAQEWCTSVVDVGPGSTQLLDVVPGRDAAGPSRWIAAKPQPWRDGVTHGVLDLSGPYRKTFDETLPQAVQVADPFHVVRLANSKLDECRRRVQNDTLGHRGRKFDPLYRARRLLTKAHERLDERGEERLVGLLEAGDPHGEVRMAWHAKEVVRSIYEIRDAELAADFVAELARDLQDETCPVEVRSLGRTIANWFEQVVAWHRSFVSNGPTEAMNNLIKRIKRIGFGFRSFAHYRVRVLLYAGKPNWDLLATVRPR